MQRYFLTTEDTAPLPFRDADELFSALEAVFWYRMEYGLEYAVLARRSIAYVDPSEYSMCSLDTQRLVENYLDVYYGYAGDTRVENYYPLFDDVVEWIDEFYGAE